MRHTLRSVEGLSQINYRRHLPLVSHEAASPFPASAETAYAEANSAAERESPTLTKVSVTLPKQDRLQVNVRERPYPTQVTLMKLACVLCQAHVGCTRAVLNEVFAIPRC